MQVSGIPLKTLITASRNSVKLQLFKSKYLMVEDLAFFENYFMILLIDTCKL